MRGNFSGEVSEWMKEYAWRAYVPRNRNRGVESTFYISLLWRIQRQPHAEVIRGRARSAEVRLAGSEGNGRKGIAEEESHPL